jgi:tetratricopeptide (TPR) repeat protein
MVCIPAAGTRAPLAALLLLVMVPAARAQCTGAVQVLVDQRRFDEARREAEPTAKRNEDDAAAAYCVGRIAYSQDRTKDAVSWFERAIDRDQNVAEYHVWLGNALGIEVQRANKFKQPFIARRIRSEFETAVRLDPRNIDARHGLVQYYSIAPGMMGGSMAKAKEQAREIERLNRMRGHMELGLLHEREKNTVEAEQELGAAITAAPDSAVAYYTLMNFHARQKNWPAAFVTLEQLVQVRPDERSTKLAYARLAALSGTNLERGEQEVKSWLASPPEDATANQFATARARLAAIYEQQGKLEEARTEFEGALGLAPGHMEARRGLDVLKKELRIKYEE